MASEDEPAGLRPNYLRRVLGASACLSPLALLLASLGVSFVSPRWAPVGIAVTACALPIACLNLCLEFIRPALHAWRHGSREGMRNVSNLSMVGTLLVLIGGVAGFGDWRAVALGLTALALDTGGSLWFLLGTWPDVWDDWPEA